MLAVRTVGADVRFIDLADFREVAASAACGFARGSVATPGVGDRGRVFVMQPMLLASERRIRRHGGGEEGEEHRCVERLSMCASGVECELGLGQLEETKRGICGPAFVAVHCK